MTRYKAIPEMCWHAVMMVSKPLPRCLLIHTGGTLGMVSLLFQALSVVAQLAHMLSFRSVARLKPSPQHRLEGLSSGMS